VLIAGAAISLAPVADAQAPKAAPKAAPAAKAQPAKAAAAPTDAELLAGMPPPTSRRSESA
jgi:hypothetical protein